MKKLLIKILLVAALGVCAPSIVLTSCSSPPSQRVVAVQTLKAVGESAEAAVSSSAQLYAGGQITAIQARQVIDFYNQKFQPTYRLAVAAVNANLDTKAPDELILLAAQLSALVLQLSSHGTLNTTPTP